MAKKRIPATLIAHFERLQPKGSNILNKPKFIIVLLRVNQIMGVTISSKHDETMNSGKFHTGYGRNQKRILSINVKSEV